MLSVKQVAQRLNVSLGTVYGLVNSGRLRAFRIGVGRGTLRVPEESLQAFLDLSIVGDGQRVSETSQTRASGRLFKHLDGDRLRAAWQRRGVRVGQPDGDNAQSSE